MISPAIATRLVARLHEQRRRERIQATPKPLTRRERDVLRLLAQGHANSAIAAELAISRAGRFARSGKHPADHPAMPMGSAGSPDAHQMCGCPRKRIMRSEGKQTRSSAAPLEPSRRGLMAFIDGAEAVPRAS